MGKRLLTVAVAGLGPAAFALGGTASAGGATVAAVTSAKLWVSAAAQAPASPGVKLKLTRAQADGELARAVIYVPSGYAVNTTQGPGTPLGTAAASVFARDQGTVLPVTGTVEVAAAADFAAQATACTDSTTHAHVWALRLQVAGTPFVFPAFVDPVPAGTPAAEFAVATVAVCLPPADVPPGTPGRAPLGASLLTAEFTTNSISNPSAAGEFRWRALATGYKPGNGEVDPASTAEVQSLVDLPTTVSLKARSASSAKRAVQTVSYGGSLLSVGKGVGSATVDIYKGASQAAAKKFKSQSTGGDGAYSGSFGVTKGKTASRLFLLAKARTADHDLGAGACTATFVPPISPTATPCIDATVAGVLVTGPVARVAIPAGPKPRSNRR
jgi:hypothetical protein